MDQRLLGILIDSFPKILLPGLTMTKVKEPSALAGEEKHGLSVGAIDLELHIPVQIAAVVLKITYFHMIHSVYSLFYTPRQSIKMGTCFAQLASQWVPPGTMRKARFTRLVISRWLVENRASALAAWLNISPAP